MTEQELAAIEARAQAEAEARQYLRADADEPAPASAMDIAALVAEVRRLRERLRAYGHD